MLVLLAYASCPVKPVLPKSSHPVMIALMKLEKRAFLGLGWMIAIGLMMQVSPDVFAQSTGAQNVAKSVLHTDGTRTDSVRNAMKKQLEESTFDARGVLISKKIFLLNENGDPNQGVIYDGAGNPVARVQFFFDEIGRLIEERRSNMEAVVFQRIIQQYDINGKALPPKAYNLNVKAPNMRAANLDFTGTKAPPKQQQLQQGNKVNTTPQPVKPGEIISASPTTGKRYKSEPETPKQPFGGTK